MASPGKSRGALITRLLERIEDPANDRYSSRKTLTLLADVLAYLQRTEPIGVEAAGAKGGAKTAETRDSEYFRVIGKRGGQKTLETHGREHFTRVGSRGGRAGKANNPDPSER